jgi:hypothetical protein
MMFRISRDPQDERFLQLKALLFVLGAGVGVAGMATDRMWLVNIGIAILAAGFILRLIKQRRDDE